MKLKTFQSELGIYLFFFFLLFFFFFFVFFYNIKLKIFKAKNGRLIMQSKLTERGFKKSRFVKNKKQKVYWVI